METNAQTPEAILNVTYTLEGGTRIRYNKPADAAFQDARRAMGKLGSVQEADAESRTVFGTCFNQRQKVKLEIDVDPLQGISEIAVRIEGNQEMTPAERGGIANFVKALAASANAAPEAVVPVQAQTPAPTTPAKPANDFFAMEKKGISKGVVGGVVMMAIAAVWFFAGLAANVIFYYPPILFLLGLYAFFKGLFTGNLAGKS